MAVPLSDFASVGMFAFGMGMLGNYLARRLGPDEPSSPEELKQHAIATTITLCAALVELDDEELDRVDERTNEEAREEFGPDTVIDVRGMREKARQQFSDADVDTDDSSDGFLGGFQ